MTGPNTRIARTQCQIPTRLGVVIALTWLNLAANAAEPALNGRWLLDPVASTDPAKELKGIVAKKRKYKPRVQTPRDVRPGGATEKRYWEEANAGREWQHSRELAHAGPLQRLLESENLEILEQDTGYLFVYADGFERPVVPNPAGRVFTASGEELTKTAVGYTLAYYDGDALVLETRIKRAGEVIERLTIDGDGRLIVSIEIDRRDWKWIAKLRRTFNRVPAAPAD